MMRACLEPECPELTTSTRCQVHERARNTARGHSRKGAYDATFRRLKAKAIREAPWCYLCRQPPSDSDPLVGDHVTPREAGGGNVPGNIRPAHASCNAHKGARIVEAGRL